MMGLPPTLFQDATGGAGGVTISTGQLILLISGIVVALWGGLVAVVKLLRDQYLKRITDLEHELTKRDATIDDYKDRDSKRAEQLQAQVETLTLAVQNTARQNELLETIMERDTKSSRPSRRPS